MNTRLWTSLGVAGMLAGAAPGQVTVDIRASQSRGVAPLAVFFDASNSTGLAGNDYLQAHFSWNFGDSAAGAWSTTGLDRNTASGFIAAHVFETPGTYTVTVTVLDIDRISADGQVSITVDDPDEVYAASNTRCVSRNGVFSGAPPGAETVSSTDLAAQLIWLNASPCRRLLLRRNETWQGVQARLTGTGPAQLGAFGDGERPVLVLQPTGEWRAPIEMNGTDIRLMDVRIDGSLLPGHGEPGAGAVSVGGQHTLVYGAEIHDAGSTALGCGGEYTFVYESVLRDNGYFSIYTAAIGVAIIGCRVDQMRIAVSFLDPPGSRDAYIAHNIINASRQAPTTGIKWHCRRGVITDNILTAGTSRLAFDHSGDAGHAVNEDLGIVLVERNLLKPDRNPENERYTSTGFTFAYGQRPVVVRNNLLNDMNIAFGGGGADSVSIYHNSIFMSDTAPGLNHSNGDFCNLRGPLHAWRIRNNIVSSDHPGNNGPGTLMVLRDIGGIDMAANLYYKPGKLSLCTVDGAYLTFAQWTVLGHETGAINADPQFLSLNPDSAGYLALGEHSPARGMGISGPVFEDFNRNPRSSGAPVEVGALVYESYAAVGRPGYSIQRTPAGNAARLFVGALTCRKGLVILDLMGRVEKHGVNGSRLRVGVAVITCGGFE